MSTKYQSPYSDKYQPWVDEFYKKNGPCCAGCDYWRFFDPVFGECAKSAPVSGFERYKALGINPCGFIPEAGHVITKRNHLCGDFKDEYDWHPHLKIIP